MRVFGRALVVLGVAVLAACSAGGTPAPAEPSAGGTPLASSSAAPVVSVAPVKTPEPQTPRPSPAPPTPTPIAMPPSDSTAAPSVSAVPASPSPSAAATAASDKPCAGGPVNLRIPDRGEEAGAPEEGWCGEACIQMALLNYGRRVSQAAINRAGAPTGHPDLWNADIERALDALGATYESWDPENDDLDGFIRWVTDQVEAGHPVILGVKFYPGGNPAWDVDHYVLAVGCNSRGLLVNTNNTGEGQILATYRELTSTKGDIYSFVNDFDRYFGCAVTGLR